MKIRQYFKKISPETKSMLRKVLWLLILCVLAFATGYYKTKTIVKEYEKNIDDYNLLDTNERVSYLSKWLSENDKR